MVSGPMPALPSPRMGAVDSEMPIDLAWRPELSESPSQALLKTIQNAQTTAEKQVPALPAKQKPTLGDNIGNIITQAILGAATGLAPDPERAFADLQKGNAERQRQATEDERTAERERRQRVDELTKMLVNADWGQRQSDRQAARQREEDFQDAAQKRRDLSEARQFQMDIKKYENELDTAKAIATAKVNGEYDVQVKQITARDKLMGEVVKASTDLINGGADATRASYLAKRRIEGTLNPQESKEYTAYIRNYNRVLHPKGFGEGGDGSKGKADKYDKLSGIVSNPTKFASFSLDNSLKAIDTTFNDSLKDDFAVVKNQKGEDELVLMKPGAFTEIKDLRGNPTGQRKYNDGTNRMFVRQATGAEKFAYLMTQKNQLTDAALQDYKNRTAGPKPAAPKPPPAATGMTPAQQARFNDIKQAQPTASDDQIKTYMKKKGWL
jgi:hypothetical protein